MEKSNFNYQTFWKERKFFLILFFFALFCDGASTVYIMLEYGPDVELHLAIMVISKVFGPVAGPIIGALGKGVAGIIVAIYLRRFSKYVFVAATLISLWAAWYNVWGVELYHANILRSGFRGE
jgi:hypothetical protein